MANIVQPTDIFLVQRGADSHKCTGLDLHDSITGGLAGKISTLEGEVKALEGEIATLKTQMAKIIKAGDVITGEMTTPDSGPDDAAFSGNIQIQL